MIRRRFSVLHSVFERTFHEERRALTGWCIGLVSYALVMVAMFPTVRGNRSIAKLLESYPEAFRSMFAISASLRGLAI